MHHLFVGINGSATATTCELGTDGLVVESFSLNPPVPSAMRLSRVAVASFAGAATVAGDWTLRVRKNEGGTDEATFSFKMDGPGIDKTAGFPSVQCLLQAGDTYHVVCGGPEKNQAYIRVTLEWEVL